jgi:hypothetical protein
MPLTSTGIGGVLSSDPAMVPWHSRRNRGLDGDGGKAGAEAETITDPKRIIRPIIPGG